MQDTGRRTENNTEDVDFINFLLQCPILFLVTLEISGHHRNTLCHSSHSDC